MATATPLFKIVGQARRDQINTLTRRLRAGEVSAREVRCAVYRDQMFWVKVYEASKQDESLKKYALKQIEMLDNVLWEAEACHVA